MEVWGKTFSIIKEKTMTWDDLKKKAEKACVVFVWVTGVSLAALGAAAVVAFFTGKLLPIIRQEVAPPTTSKAPERGEIRWEGDRVTYWVEGEARSDVETIFSRIAPNKAFILQQPPSKAKPVLVPKTKNEPEEQIAEQSLQKPTVVLQPPVEESPPPKPAKAAVNQPPPAKTVSPQGPPTRPADKPVVTPKNQVSPHRPPNCKGTTRWRRVA